MESFLTPESEKMLTSHLYKTPGRSVGQSDEASGHAAKKQNKKKLLQHEQGAVSPEEEFKLSWSFTGIACHGHEIAVVFYLTPVSS